MEGAQRINELEEQIRLLAREQVTARERLEELHTQLLELRKEISGTGQGSRVAEAAGSGQQATSGNSQHGLEQFIGLRLIHLAGIIVLLTGISIGIKYAIDKDLVSPMARIILAYGAGLVLLLFAWRLRSGYNFFSAILFSGSMACWYFTTYGALAYYGFISVPIAFAGMAALTIFTIVQSIYYNRIEIALIGLVGAYGIPFLVSNNTGRIDLFFSYIMLINAGVVYLSCRRNWRAVSVLALIITWALFIGWLLLEYSQLRSVPAIIFAIAFYALFVCDATIRRFTRRGPLTTSNQLQVLVLNGLLYVAMAIIISNFESGPVRETGYMCLYLALLALLIRKNLPGETRFYGAVLIEALALLVLFIALQWDGVTVTVLWLLLAVILFIAGVLARQSWLRICSVLLVGGTLLKLITIDSVRFSAGQRILSFIVIGVLLLVGSFYYQRFNQNKAPEKL